MCGCDVVSADREEREVTVSVPFDGSMDSLSVGDSVEIVIRGKIVNADKSLKREEWMDSKGNVRVAVDNVEMDGVSVWDF